MSLVTKITALAQAIALDIKTITQSITEGLDTKLSVTTAQGLSAGAQLIGRQNLNLTTTEMLGEFTDKLLLTGAERTKLEGLRQNGTTGVWERLVGGLWIPFGQILQAKVGIIPVTTGTSTTPFDNTAPLISEGFVLATDTITPFLPDSTIYIIYSLMLDSSQNNRTITAAAYAGTNLISCSAANLGTAGRPISTTFTHRHIPGSTTPINLSIRVGANGGGTTYVNRGVTATLNNNAFSAYLILEIKN